MSRAQAILGTVDDAALGVTLMHEHLTTHRAAPRDTAIRCSVTDADLRAELVRLGEDFGVTTVVDCSPRLPPDQLEARAELSRSTGLNVVVATGCQKERYYNPGARTQQDYWAYRLSVDEIAAVMVEEIRTGIRGTGFRAGIIKVGTSKNRITPAEERVLRAAARAHELTGCPITTHATLGTMGPEQAQVFLGEGVDMAHVVIGHSDLNASPGYHDAITQTGATVGFDTIGKCHFDYVRSETAGTDRYDVEKEHYYIPDATRLDSLSRLREAGMADRVVVSSDIGLSFADNQETFGRRGYAYLLAEFLPAATERGMTPADRTRMLVDNPRRILGNPRLAAPEQGDGGEADR